MIQRLQNINFTSTGIQAQTKEAPDAAIQEQSKEKFSLTQTYTKAKKGVTDVFKTINNVAGVTQGSARGVVEGGIAAAVISVAGKNIKNADGKILGTLKGIGSDLWKTACVLPKTIKAVIVKSPLDNVKSLAKATVNGTKQLAKGVGKHKLTALVATVSALGVFALRTIQGKVSANDKNASLDHKTNQGHV